MNRELLLDTMKAKADAFMAKHSRPVLPSQLAICVVADVAGIPYETTIELMEHIERRMAVAADAGGAK